MSLNLWLFNLSGREGGDSYSVGVGYISVKHKGVKFLRRRNVYVRKA